MRLSPIIVLSCAFAVAGCESANDEARNHYQTLLVSFKRMAHKKIGTAELLSTKRADRFDLVIKRGEYLNRPAKSTRDPNGDEYCADFSVIRAIDAPYSGLILPYSKTDVLNGRRMALANSVIIANTEPETVLAIPDELPGTPGLEKPFKLQHEVRRHCFYRSVGASPE